MWVIRFMSYISCSIMNLLRLLHKTYGSGITAHGILRNSGSGVALETSFSIMSIRVGGVSLPMRIHRNFTSGVSAHGILRNSGSGVSAHAWGPSKSPLKEFLRVGSSKTKVVEFLRKYRILKNFSSGVSGDPVRN